LLSQLVFSVTKNCPISCTYCVTRSGPFDGPSLDSHFMCGVIKELSDIEEVKLIVFTGGEPLLLKDQIVKTLQYASSQGIWTRVVTNAFWATTPSVACEMLKELTDAGLREINFSCDDFHQKHIPIDNICNAMEAALSAGLSLLIAHKEVRNGEICESNLSQLLGKPMCRFDPSKKEQPPYLYDTGLTIPVGHGSEYLPEDQYIIFPPEDDHWKTPCTGVLSSTIIGPERDLRLCCGMIEQDVPELSFGSLNDYSLKELICTANCDLIANWLALEGPYGILRFVQDRQPEITLPGRFVGRCHLCNHLFTRQDVRDILRTCNRHKVEDLSLRRGLLEAARSIEI
jgi:hypothetical protein